MAHSSEQKKRAKKDHSIGVAVGRFQVHTLHEGHRYLIDEMYKRHTDVLVLIGAHDAQPTDRDPLSFEQRRALLQEVYPAITVAKIDDHPSDDVWSQELDKLITETAKGRNVILYGSRDSFIPYYCGRYETCTLKEITGVSGSKQRQEMSTNVTHSEPFRRGVIHAVTGMREPIVYTTVSVAVLRSSKKEVLLCRRPHEVKWHFLGGVVTPADTSFEYTAKRVIAEMVGDDTLDDLLYISSAKINDRRFHKAKDSILSPFFVTSQVFGVSEEINDQSDLQWFPVHDVAEYLHDDHLQFGKALAQYLKEKNSTPI